VESQRLCPLFWNPVSFPGFLSEPERAASQQEWRSLQTDPPTGAVRTRGYTNGAHTTTFPKQAFILLHTKYPNPRGQPPPPTVLKPGQSW
jgi:hypothetical protein